jgi:hypothetical protein
MREMAAKKMAKVLSCLAVIAVLMSTMPILMVLRCRKEGVR